MKAIIIAAGMGKRMEGHTRDIPKCLLPFKGKPLMQIQLDILRSLGIDDITVITGYKKEKVDFPGLKYYVNEDFENNNILESLFYAEPEIEGEVIIHYCDILFEKSVVENLLACREEISIVVDINWKENYIDRRDHPIDEAENVIFDDNFKVQQIGKIMDGEKEGVPGEFIGMMKVSGTGAETLKKRYHASRKKFEGKPFQRAKTFQKAYLTDLIQELVDHSINVVCVPIRNKWKEIDTIEDFNKATHIIENMVL